MAIFRHTTLALVVCAQIAAANTIVSTSSSSRFETGRWTGTRRINNNGQPFFDNRSDDGPTSGSSGCNIGHYLIGPSSACSGSSQPGSINRFDTPNYKGPTAGTNGADFWRSSSANVADRNFDFTSNSPFFTVQLMAAAAGNAAINQIGIYTLDSNGGIYSTLLLLAGNQFLQPVTFSPGDRKWGFFLTNGTRTYYMNSTLNAPDDVTTQHFAVFRDPTDPNNNLTNNAWQKLWIGIEDNRGGVSDFNDAILFVQCVSCGAGATAAPEVGTSWLVAGGAALIGISQFRRRRPARAVSTTRHWGADPHPQEGVTAPPSREPADRTGSTPAEAESRGNTDSPDPRLGEY
jgi:hypothetical protein